MSGAEKQLDAGEFAYNQEADIPAFLRRLADSIEKSGEMPASAAVVFGSLGETVWVDGAGLNGSIETVGLLRLGEHVVLNNLMPFGSVIHKEE